MSSTGRKKQGGDATPRQAKDNYPTPLWAIRAILSWVWQDVADPRLRPIQDGKLRRIHVLDPCCGEGGFMGELARLTSSWADEKQPNLHGFDIRPEAVVAQRAGLAATGHRHNLVSCLDFTKDEALLDGYDLALSNPPYGDAEASPDLADLASTFVKRAVQLVRPGGQVVMLLRMNWLTDGEHDYGRATWLRTNMPDVAGLDRRPSFIGGTDSCGYAALRWIRGRHRTAGESHLIHCRPQIVIPILDGYGFDIGHFQPEDWRKKTVRKPRVVEVENDADPAT